MRHLSFMIIFIFSHLISIAQIANKEAYEGNKLYASGQFKEAESKYQSSLKNQQNKEIQYNLGNALYQQKKWDEANKQFTSVANVAKDKHLKSIANHNIGNAFLEQKNGMKLFNISSNLKTKILILLKQNIILLMLKN
ncbi:MAG: putative BatB/BatC protein, partial [Bacteroidetes bacterium OLB11]